MIANTIDSDLYTNSIPHEKCAAIFLDRDGTISSDQFGYIDNPESYRLFSYTTQALKIMRHAGYKLFLVTNQSGIARGYFTIEQLNKVHQKMLSLIEADNASIDKVYFSPYFKDGIIEPYNVDHQDRKPGLGMFWRAKAEYNINPFQSWMIGDRYSDIKFGTNAKMKTILLLTGNGKKEFIEDLPNWDIKPDFVAENLLTAARLIGKYYSLTK